MAYVEYEEDHAASKALIQTDGMLIGDNQISVAISNPPRRAQGSEGGPSLEEKREKIAQSLGAGSVTSRSTDATSSTATKTGQNNNSANNKSQTPLAFVPRSQLMGRKKTLNL